MAHLELVYSDTDLLTLWVDPEQLQFPETQTPAERLLCDELRDFGPHLSITIGHVAAVSGLTAEAVRSAIAALVAGGTIIQVSVKEKSGPLRIFQGKMPARLETQILLTELEKAAMEKSRQPMPKVTRH